MKRVSTLPMAVMNSFLFCATIPTFEKFIAVFSLPTINSCLICIFVEVVYAFGKLVVPVARLYSNAQQRKNPSCIFDFKIMVA